MCAAVQGAGNAPDQCCSQFLPESQASTVTPNPGNAGVFQSAGLQNRGLALFPVPREVRGSRCQEECPLDIWLGAQPLGAKARKVSPPLWGLTRGRKEGSHAR